jgi:hypothetical protein
MMPKAKTPASKSKPPWRKPNPKAKAKSAARKLTPAEKSAAKARAAKAGRPYPNLVDNMAVANSRKSSAKSPSPKT